MKRLALIGSWKRLGIQLGLLGGLGLAFVGGGEKPAQAGGDCTSEGLCSFKKPNLLIVLDYSSSMSEDLIPGQQTRWEAAVEAVQNIVTTDNGFFDDSMHLALMRFGHDPQPGSPNTVIANDTSGIVDGHSIDVGWYDTNDPDSYYECNGDEIVNFLNQVAPPLCQQQNAGDPCSGIGTWTNGALQAARDYIAQTRSDHPDDVIVDDERYYGILLLTDGNWGTANGAPPVDPDNDPENPTGTAAALFTTDDVPTYVVAFGDAVGEQFADDLALAGGTNASIQAGMGELVQSLQSVVEDIEDQVIIPECTGGLPRIMVILDASSSMLNDGNAAGAMGQTGWDQAREALSGQNSIFDVQVAGVNNQPIEDLVHLGLTTFGSEGAQQVLVDYGPCMKDNFGWALDPNTSCGAGCNDPWGGPPILWTPQGPNGANYPGFDQATYSTMPLCDTGQNNPNACTGSATATHGGLELAASNAAAYQATPPALYPVNDDTVFANILITDGQYLLGNWSTDEEVSAALTQMFQDGITTYVIGFGPAANLSTTELDNMACWGSGGTGIPCNGGSNPAYSAGTQAGLQADIETIIEQINFDPCCGFNDCSFNPEPTTGEPDPIVGDGSSGGESDTEGDTDGTGGDTDSDSDTAGSASASASDSDSDTAGGSDSDTAGGSDSAATVTAGGSDSGDGDSDTDGDTAGASDPGDEGCGCSTDRRSNDGLLGLFAFGLFGALRRRRR